MGAVARGAMALNQGNKDSWAVPGNCHGKWGPDGGALGGELSADPRSWRWVSRRGYQGAQVSAMGLTRAMGRAGQRRRLTMGVDPAAKILAGGGVFRPAPVLTPLPPQKETRPTGPP